MTEAMGIVTFVGMSNRAIREEAERKPVPTSAARRQFIVRTCGLSSALIGSASYAQTPAAKSTSLRRAVGDFPKPEKKAIVIATASRHALVYLPLMVADQLGLFAQVGLEVEIIEHQSMARAQQAALAGSADVICGWLENALTQQGRGPLLQSFVLMGRAPQISLGVSSRFMPAVPITRLTMKSQIAQLRGRKIGVLSMSSPTHTVAHAILRHAGLRSAEMSFLSVGSAASAAAALRSGQIDVLAHLDPLMMQLEQHGEIILLADTHSPEGTQLATGAQLPSSCLTAAPDVLLRFPGAMQAVSDAMVLALRWLNQASLLNVMKVLPDAAMGDDRQAFIGSLERLREALSPDGIMPPTGPEQLLAAMSAAEPTLRLQSIDASKSFTNAFVHRSATRLKA